jgi:hypothetical protein
MQGRRFHWGSSKVRFFYFTITFLISEWYYWCLDTFPPWFRLWLRSCHADEYKLWFSVLYRSVFICCVLSFCRLWWHFTICVLSTGCPPACVRSSLLYGWSIPGFYWHLCFVDRMSLLAHLQRHVQTDGELCAYCQVCIKESYSTVI